MTIVDFITIITLVFL